MSARGRPIAVRNHLIGSGGRMLLVGILIALFLPAAGSAQAHAYLERSVPADREVLDTAPTELRLWFSEPVEVSFSKVYLFDPAGKRVGEVGSPRPAVSGGASATALGKPSASGAANPPPQFYHADLLVVPVEPLPPGVYAVGWSVLSSIDGHPSGGSFVFAVGRDQVPAGGWGSTPTVASIAGSGLATALAVLAKWLGYLSLALLVGGSTFLLLIRQTQPALSPAKPVGKASPLRVAPGTAPDSFPSSLFAVLLGGWILAVLATLLGMVGLGAASASGGSAALIGGTRQGILHVVRFLILLALAMPLLYARGRMRRQEEVPRRVWLTCLGLGGLILLFISLGSHAARGGEPLISIAADWLHLMAASVWVGGLTMLTLALPLVRQREKTQPFATVHHLLTRFSRLAAVGVVMVVATGTYRAVFEIADWENLTDTAYGTTLLFKVGLLMALLGLAAANLLLIGPRLGRAAREPKPDGFALLWLRRLRQTLRGEVMLVLAILLLSSILAGQQPGREALGSGLVVRGEGPDLRVALVVKADEPGIKTLDVFLRDGGGRPLAGADKVAFIVTTAGDEGVESETVADNVGNGHYLARVSGLARIDKRNVVLLVRRIGRDDARLTLDLSQFDLRG